MPAKNSFSRVLLAVLLVCAVSACGCGKSNGDYFTHNSVDKMKENFEGYAASERKRPRALSNTVSDYVEDEKKRVEHFPEEFPPAWENQKKDAHNFMNTIRDYIANQ